MTDPQLPADSLKAEATASGRPAVWLPHLDETAPAVVPCVVAWPGDAPLVGDVVPLFESLGVRVARHASTPEVDSFELLDWPGRPGDDVTRFRDALAAIHLGQAERDGLNGLVLRHGLDWRQVALVRALCRYLRQAGSALGLAYVEQTLLRNGEVVRAVVALFEARFDPDSGSTEAEEAADARIEGLLDAVATLDDDRVLRRLADVVRATMRTSYYQRDEAGEPLDRLTLKIEPGRLDFVAEPRPLVETFVYAPRVEGLHLRTARVARGGLRWSERPEDFRAEVLGLMKAQAVKNSVIVPAGAKGAFVVRTPVAGLERSQVQEVVRSGYATFIRGLLDVTDNLVDGEVRPPARVRRHDDTDAYLVVAADKGTARFSDLANEVAAEYGFWLGDAFASGGSAGYDHKGMGITARGAWVSVEAHLREIGFDAATDELTVVGIGDMSGDVFGNGMLLSDRIRLVAAFDHRHVFLDPDPDPAASYAERQRLFALPTSDWASYDPALISPGGGVYPRQAKRIPVSARVRERLGIATGRDWLTPDELVRAILTAPVTLLWNGGIGTYVKAGEETHAQVGDKANDAVRVDADELRCRVVGEGGNLGLTQRARIEYAAAGGRVNADFIDNSAGVDTSDHEVNLKVLLDAGLATGRVSAAERSRLLASMQDAVAAAVLEDNRRQALAISLAVEQGALGLDRHARLIALLERDTGLDRRLEHLPDDDEIARRRVRGVGLTRPEVATLLATSKISVRGRLLESTLPDDPQVQAMLGDYFPPQVRRPDLIAAHPLAREIAGTVLANDIVNQAGPGFFCRLEERTGALLPDAARAFVVARHALGLDELWQAVDTDDRASVAGRFRALAALRELLEHAATWVLRRTTGEGPLAEQVAHLADDVARVRGSLDSALDPDQQDLVAEETATLVAAGLPEPVAHAVAQSGPMAAALAVVEAARNAGTDPATVGRVFFEVGRVLDLDWLRGCARPSSGDSHWRELAGAALADELTARQGAITVAVLRHGAGSEDPVAAWLKHRQEPVRRHRALLAELRGVAQVDLAMLVLATQLVGELAG